MRTFSLLALLLICNSLFSQKKGKKNQVIRFVTPTIEVDSEVNLETPYEKSGLTKTATYFEAIEWYKALHRQYPGETELKEIGNTDAGWPIYCFRIFNSMDLQGVDPGPNDGGVNRTFTEHFSVKILINNNIHPGEPEGTDASMLFARNVLSNAHYFRHIRRNSEISIIIQYNVDGTLNRNKSSRANQDGPVEYGFRGNAKNLDLNRDFIKMDSRNAQTLVKFMAKEKFDYFIDNHTSNGADYQYTLTYFHTRVEKLPSYLVKNTLMVDTMLKLSLKNAGWPTSPYVNTMQEVPDSGLVGFYESPRFATGWAALNHTIGFTVETHMLKPFPKRVESTRDFLNSFVGVVTSARILSNLKTSKFASSLDGRLPLKEYTQFKLDQNQYEKIDFLGYEFGYKPSEVSGKPRLYYDRSKPKTILVKYYNHYIPTDSVELPKAYIIPYAYKEVLERINLNGIQWTPIQHDTVIKSQVSYIVDFKTVKEPYEGHYLHSQVITRDTIMAVKVSAGDKLIRVDSKNAKFLAATLEPKSPDSYFCWNFFDGILQQKEGYSAYVFEDRAAEILKANPKLREKLEAKRKSDSTFANDGGAQLDFVYKNSEYYEPSHRRYPVYRILW